MIQIRYLSDAQHNLGKKSAEHEDIVALGNLILALATKGIADSAFQSHEPDLAVQQVSMSEVL